MKENTIYLESYKSEYGDIKVWGMVKGERFGLLGTMEEKDKMIEATRRTMANVKKYGIERYDEKDVNFGFPNWTPPKTKFPICHLQNSEKTIKT